MSTSEPGFWQRADLAREKLSFQLTGRPEVSLIDIGLDPKDPASSQQIYLRVHLRPNTDLHQLNLPSEVDGIPVIAIAADYHLE